MNPDLDCCPSDSAARHQYVKDVLGRFILDSSTRPRMLRKDWLLAHQLYDHDVPLEAVEAAFILAKIRRDLRPPGAPPPSPIRSLAYFGPIIEEIMDDPPDLGPLHNLSLKLDQLESVRQYQPAF